MQPKKHLRAGSSNRRSAPGGSVAHSIHDCCLSAFAMIFFKISQCWPSKNACRMRAIKTICKRCSMSTPSRKLHSFGMFSIRFHHHRSIRYSPIFSDHCNDQKSLKNSSRLITIIWCQSMALNTLPPTISPAVAAWRKPHQKPEKPLILISSSAPPLFIQTKNK